jgi:hypothetical protein
VVGVCAVQDGVEERTVRPNEFACELGERSGSDVQLAAGSVKRDCHAHVPEEVEHFDGVARDRQRAHQKTS